MFETILTQLKATSWIEWFGMLTGVAGIWLSIKERVSAWVFFIACYAAYIWISYAYGLYAFLVMNAAFVTIAAYGLYKWSRGTNKDEATLPIRTTKRAHWPLVVIFMIAGTIGVGALLSLRGEASMPYLDALAACSGFVAQWMLSRKQIETWLFWLISDTVYLYIFIQNASWPSTLLFGIFIILATKGWLEWRKNPDFQK